VCGFGGVDEHGHPVGVHEELGPVAHVEDPRVHVVTEDGAARELVQVPRLPLPALAGDEHGVGGHVDVPAPVGDICTDENAVHD
jgi:hypothetical protein